MAKAMAVFDTVELLESILHKLPTKDLLFAQGVCKHWKQVIERSPKLQRALFFKPVDLDLLRVENPHEEIFDFYRFSTSTRDQYIVIENPLLKRVHLLMDYAMEGPNNKSGVPSSNLPRRWLRSEASWRHMLFTQPAIELDWTPPCAASHKYDTKKVRAGAILEDIDKWYAENPAYGSFGSVLGDWVWKELECNEQLENLEALHMETEDDDDSDLKTERKHNEAETSEEDSSELESEDFEEEDSTDDDSFDEDSTDEGSEGQEDSGGA